MSPALVESPPEDQTVRRPRARFLSSFGSASGGDANCDLLDDGALNSSCGTDCPLGAGIYTLTQTAGGSLRLDGFGDSFPSPSGGTIIQHVSAATAPDCVHNTVVPFPGNVQEAFNTYLGLIPCGP